MHKRKKQNICSKVALIVADNQKPSITLIFPMGFILRYAGMGGEARKGTGGYSLSNLLCQSQDLTKSGSADNLDVFARDTLLAGRPFPFTFSMLFYLIAIA